MTFHQNSRLLPVDSQNPDEFVAFLPLYSGTSEIGTPIGEMDFVPCREVVPFSEVYLFFPL